MINCLPAPSRKLNENSTINPEVRARCLQAVISLTFGVENMKPSDQTDIPGTRITLETVATKFNIYFLLVIALVGGAIAIVGLIGLGGDLDSLSDVPDAVMLMALGLIAFSLFFPWCMALYFARHLLLSVKNIEGEIATLKTDTEQVGADQPATAPESNSEGKEKPKQESGARSQ